ncbi:hypothetical protein HK405_007677 [Cladochytrium tenue]|nr:hypothetical protein HK405_007677 [Cladochytrium tenue]
MPTPATAPQQQVLRFHGHQHLRQRLLLATLSGKPVRIDRIRPSNPSGDQGAALVDGPEDHSGLMDYEVSFLRLLEKVTNGSTVEISYSGSAFIYRPGVITGGAVQHDCPPSRAIGYFLEPMVALAPFAKQPLRLTLTGVTNNNVDVGVDLIRTVLLPTLRRFLPASAAASGGSLDLRIVRRGLLPLGGGEVTFQCPTVRGLVAPSAAGAGPAPLGEGGRRQQPTGPAGTAHAALATEPGQPRRAVRRVRGVAYAARVAPATAGRVADAARAVLTRFLPDVYVYVDAARGAEAGRSPGYGCALVAESLGTHLHSAETTVHPRRAAAETAAEEEAAPTAAGPTAEAGVEEMLAGTAAGSGSKRPRLEVEVDAAGGVAAAADSDDDGDEADSDGAGSPGARTQEEFLTQRFRFATPEALGVRCARQLLSEIAKGGCVDTVSQWLVVLMLALGPEGDVGRVRVGGSGVGGFLAQFLRDVRSFLGVEFRIAADRDAGEVVLTCVGCGYVNVNKAVA